MQNDCHDCGCHIEPGEEYYQLTLISSYSWEEWVTKGICTTRYKTDANVGQDGPLCYLAAPTVTIS